ncbi:aldo/keto reductase [Egicoccus halophilus]|uniref:Oxidoreductase n=1 Tax=Egicoccus halophilus TaxID=1670830 RepID=A0A8J3ABG0_9ACTN|nr:aldo/keto reductase [Egicoccus halophilus]GGI09626.1 oxidoreductase [Egicoccus halophilus]
MEYRRLGDSGLVVSAVGLGGNNFGRRLDLPGSRAVVEAALDAGITLIDTADVYGDSEEYLGKILTGRRDEVVLATKFGMAVDHNGPSWQARGSRAYVRRAVESSLRRLRTDHIDLYQLHAPDPATPIEETLGAMTELVHEGKVRYLGSSNLAGWQIVDADWTATSSGLERFVSAQNHYSLLERDVEAEVVPACEHLGIGLLPYFPLASGLLTGKYRRGEPAPEGTRLHGSQRAQRWLNDERFDVVEALQDFADARGIGLLDVAVGGLAAQPAVGSVIAGATAADQVVANVAAAAWTPTEEDLEELDRLAPTPRSA